MPEWLFLTLTFGIGPAMALGLWLLIRWRQHQDDLEAWDRAQALRRQIREQQEERRTAGVKEGAKHTFAPSVPSVLPPMSGLSGEAKT